jgi:hypothetical protein
MPDTCGVHEAVLEPRLDAGRVELHPPHGVAQQRACTRDLLAGEMLVPVPHDRIGLISRNHLAARPPHRFRKRVGRLGRKPDAGRVRRLVRHGCIA